MALPSELSGFGAAPPSADSSLEASTLEQALGRRLPSARWIGWRLRLLLGAALAGCLGLVAVVGLLASAPHLEASFRAEPSGALLLIHSTDARLRDHQGRRLVAIEGRGLAAMPTDALWLQRTTRWLVHDTLREQVVQAQERLARHLAAPSLRLRFADGGALELAPEGRGLGGLGTVFWLLAALSLVLYLIGMVVVLAWPGARNVLYALMAWGQSANLLLIAAESLPGLGLPAGAASLAPTWRIALDLLTGAALVHACAMHPRRLPGHALIGTATWIAALLLAAGVANGRVSEVWWAVQGASVAFGVATVALLSWSYRLEPNPFAIVLRRFSLVGLGILVLLTLSVAAADDRPLPQFNIAAVGSSIWYVFFASLLLLVPFLSRSRQMMREFAMLAGISTVATSLDLLFVVVFSLGQFVSLTLALFISLGAYAGARQWILNHMLGTRLLTTERMFEQLYRIAREVEQHPEAAAALLTRLLRELFEPLEVIPLARGAERTQVLRDGSTMLVPMPPLIPGADTSSGMVVLRFAQRGKRLFTQDDARLADGIVEQLRRAVAYDQAVERGRSEERTRIAQDLHDDIGARLLTLMYQAPTPEMEDYLRHTLQDLKTLTRGLAAASHPLSDAAAEWKADLTQRLAAVQCDLHWSFTADREVVLNVVQWSGLTRILRELVNNAISHAQASRLDVQLSYEGGRLTLTLCDDGVGGEPAGWSHGLGLGGIRKRVKQLDGTVEWRRNLPRGICCRVVVPRLDGGG